MSLALAVDAPYLPFVVTSSCDRSPEAWRLRGAVCGGRERELQRAERVGKLRSCFARPEE